MTIALVIILFATTWYTLRNPLRFEQGLFRVDDILIRKEYYRLLSAGFLHVDWIHFAFNAIALYSFGKAVEAELPIQQYLLLFLGSLVGGNLLALFIHRQHGDYSAVGASGAVSGVAFAFTLFYPDAKIGLIMLPFHVNAVIFSFIYLLATIYGVKSKKGNIGHEAHLGGAVTGLIVAALLRHDVFLQNWKTFLILLTPTVIFLTLISIKPEIMLIDGYMKYRRTRFREVKRKAVVHSRSEEIDRILDKINRSGLESLTRKEREFLKKEEGNSIRL